MNRAEFKEFEGRIDNWRVVFHTSMHYGKCGSVEGRYRGDEKPPRGEEPARPRVLDHVDAVAMEDAWKTLWAQWAKWMIKWHYIDQFPKQAIMRRMQKQAGRGIRPDCYDRELFVAVELLKRNLDMRQARPHTRVQQSDSTFDGVHGSP